MEKTNGFMGDVWFFVLFLYLIAVIGGIGYAIYDKNYVIAGVCYSRLPEGEGDFEETHLTYGGGAIPLP